MASSSSSPMPTDASRPPLPRSCPRHGKRAGFIHAQCAGSYRKGRRVAPPSSPQLRTEDARSRQHSTASCGRPIRPKMPMLPAIIDDAQPDVGAYMIFHREHRAMHRRRGHLLNDDAIDVSSGEMAGPTLHVRGLLGRAKRQRRTFVQLPLIWNLRSDTSELAAVLDNDRHVSANKASELPPSNVIVTSWASAV